MEESLWKSYFGKVIWNSLDRVLRRSLELPEIQFERDSVERDFVKNGGDQTLATPPR